MMVIKLVFMNAKAKINKKYKHLNININRFNKTNSFIHSDMSISLIAVWQSVKLWIKFGNDYLLTVAIKSILFILSFADDSFVFCKQFIVNFVIVLFFFFFRLFLLIIEFLTDHFSPLYVNEEVVPLSMINLYMLTFYCSHTVYSYLMLTSGIGTVCCVEMNTC